MEAFQTKGIAKESPDASVRTAQRPLGAPPAPQKLSSALDAGVLEFEVFSKGSQHRRLLGHVLPHFFPSNSRHF